MIKYPFNQITVKGLVFRVRGRFTESISKTYRPIHFTRKNDHTLNRACASPGAREKLCLFFSILSVIELSHAPTALSYATIELGCRLWAGEERIGIAGQTTYLPDGHWAVHDVLRRTIQGIRSHSRQSVVNSLCLSTKSRTDERTLQKGQY